MNFEKSLDLVWSFLTVKKVKNGHLNAKIKFSAGSAIIGPISWIQVKMTKNPGKACLTGLLKSDFPY